MRKEVLRTGPSTGQRRWVPALVLFFAAVVGACAKDGNATPKPSAPAASPAAAPEPEVLATIGEEKVTLTDVRAAVGPELDQLEMKYLRQRHKVIENAMMRTVLDRILAAEAKKQGKGLDQLISDEAGGSVEPTAVEVQNWYNANPARVRGAPLAQVESQIIDLLRNEKRNAAAMRLEERLRKDHQVSVMLEPFRVELNNEGAPSVGPANAPVTLVEFSDFQCPYCQSYVSRLKTVKENYADRVRIVYRQYPIPSLHANAIKAAEASLCAQEQGKFWEMHDLMFQEQNRLTVAELKEKAARLKMNKSKFDSCLDTGRFTEQVQEDMKEGSRFGVTGTPAIFLNGVLVDGGAVSYETLAKAIDKELARVKK
jgi:predicted DsbA family dithiol-disulfide isomerase